MPLINAIQEEQLNLRKSGQSQHAAFLATLLGDARAIGKNAGNRETTDSEVIAVIKKFIKNVEETIQILSKANPVNAEFDPSSPAAIKLGNLVVERQLYAQFLPHQLAEEELQTAITGIVRDLGATTQKQMGAVLAALKTQYDGQYDGKLASALVKAQLQ